jgi:hypothetical protein
MAKRGYKGGGFFTDDITGKTTMLGSLTIAFVGIIMLGALGVLTYFLIKDFGKGQSTQPSGGPQNPVAPPMSNLPGRIKIAEIAQAPSAGQAVIYFSQAEGPGVSCETCTADFDIQLSYDGGNPKAPPAFKKETAPSKNGLLTFDYSVLTPSPGSNQNIRVNQTPPSFVNITVNARSVNPQTGVMGSLTSFNKRLAYIA